MLGEPISARTMELHNKFRKQVKSPINNETINVIEHIETIPIKNNFEDNSSINLKRISVLSESSSTLNQSNTIDITTSSKNNNNNNNKDSLSTAGAKNSSYSNVNKSSIHKENVFKKLKSKFKEKLDL